MFRFWLLFILTVATLIAVLIATDAIKEGFAATSPGTLLQLKTSHVRTVADEEEEKNMITVINQGLLQMTGDGLY